MTRQDTSNYST